jgi:hypothetical protein
METINTDRNICYLSNFLINGFIRKATPASLKLMLFIAKDADKITISDSELSTFNIDMKDLSSKFNISTKSIKQTSKRLMNVVISIPHDKNYDFTDCALFPKVSKIKGKEILEISMFNEVIKLFIASSNGFTSMIIDSLLKLKSSNTIKLAILLIYIKGFDKKYNKRKTWSLDDINEYFGTHYKNYSGINKNILEIAKKELDEHDDLPNFLYESNCTNYDGNGRPTFDSVNIDIIK